MNNAPVDTFWNAYYAKLDRQRKTEIERLDYLASVGGCDHRGTPQRIYSDGRKRCSRCGVTR